MADGQNLQVLGKWFVMKSLGRGRSNSLITGSDGLEGTMDVSDVSQRGRRPPAGSGKCPYLPITEEGRLAPELERRGTVSPLSMWRQGSPNGPVSKRVGWARDRSVEKRVARED
jgi:hypothetical protein